MFNSLKKKPLTIALLTSGVILGGIGTASAVSAQTTTDDDTPDTTIEAERPEGAERQARGEGRGHRGKGCGKSLEAVAEVIGIEVDDLRAALDEGQSLSEVAEANNVDPDEVVDALIAEADARLDEKVEAGRLTEDEAAEKLADATERAEDRVAGVERPDRSQPQDEAIAS